MGVKGSGVAEKVCLQARRMDLQHDGSGEWNGQARGDGREGRRLSFQGKERHESCTASKGNRRDDKLCETLQYADGEQGDPL